MKRLIYSIFLSLIGFGITAVQAADAISTANVNVRSGPGTRYTVRTSIPAGYRVNLAGCSGNWCRVNIGGYGGWVSANYLAFNQGRTPYRANSYARGGNTVVVPLVIGAGWGGYHRYHGRHYHRHHRYYSDRRWRQYHHRYGSRHHYRPYYRPHHRPHYRPYRHHRYYR